MLYNVDTSRPILTPTRPDTWRLITHGPNKLTPVEFDNVIAGIDQLMIGTHDKVTVPGFEAGSDWSGLPWEILWSKAAAKNHRLAAWMLGLTAQYAFIVHPADWCTGSTTYAGHEYPNAYYFQRPVPLP